MNIIHTPWMKHDDKSFSAEISEFKGELFTDEKGFPFNLGNFTRHTDREHDVTHWELVRNGITYTVFND
jgi:hypothetical protein